MPITRSAKEALRQNARRRTHNLVRKDAYKKAVKEYRKLAAAKEMEKAKALLPMVYKTLDKAAKTGVLKKNAASRLKSRLARLLKK